MSIPLPSGTYLADNANLSGSDFHNVNLSGAKFDDVNLRGAEFNNVGLTNSKFHNICFGDVTIEHASYQGMKIEGILVTELLRVYTEHFGVS